MAHKRSIQTYFFLAFAALALTAFVVSLAVVRSDWRTLEAAASTRDHAHIYEAMTEISGTVGRERAYYIQVLQEGRAPPQGGVRMDTDKALAFAQAILGSPQEQHHAVSLDDVIARLADVRRLTDEALVRRHLPPDEAIALSDRFDELKAKVVAIEESFEMLVDQDGTAEQRTLLDLARLAESMRTAAGTRAALMVTTVGAELPPAEAVVARLNDLAGQLNGQWHRIQRLQTLVGQTGSDGLPGSVRDAIAKIGTDYMGDLSNVYVRLLDAKRRGETIPTEIGELYARNVTSITGIYQLVATASREAATSAEAGRLKAAWEMAASLGFPLIILTIAVVSVALVRNRVLRPLASLTTIIKELSTGKHDMTVPALTRKDEMGELATVIEHLRRNVQRTSELEKAKQAMAAQLQQAQKMEAMGQLTGGMAHDFNNLLGVVIGNLDLVSEMLEPGEPRTLVEAGLHAAERGADLTRQLLAFARRQPLAPQRVQIGEVLGGMAQILSRTLGRHITLALNIGCGVWPVDIDVSQLESAVLNLAVNAGHAMPNGGNLIIEAGNESFSTEDLPDADVAPGDYVCISVSDTGTGMTQEVLARAFEPFFTTKGARHGTGLGLSMVHGFVKQSGGHTKIYSEPGYGTTVRLYLPRSRTDSAQSEAPEHRLADRPPHGNEIILVVEDNPDMRAVAVRQLTSLGYHTVEAGNASEALERIGAGERLDLLFTDVIMPGGIDGRELATSARALRPDLKVLFTSGFTGEAAHSAVDGSLGANLLSKPYRKIELARRVRAALDAPTALAA